jgi:hypothetical protein
VYYNYVNFLNLEPHLAFHPGASNTWRRLPYVLGDELVGAVRKVKVDEVGEQSHGNNNGDVFSLSLDRRRKPPLSSQRNAEATSGVSVCASQHRPATPLYK